MDLVERYLGAVRWNLPAAKADDIVAELRHVDEEFRTLEQLPRDQRLKLDRPIGGDAGRVPRHRSRDLERPDGSHLG